MLRIANLNLPLDYTDDTLRPLSAEMIVNGLSDHNALAVTFEFLDPEE